MKAGFNTKELDEFSGALFAVSDGMALEIQKFMRKSGTELRKDTLSVMKKLGTKTGNYRKSIKRGRVYRRAQDGTWAVRVYSYARHAHLIEEGHRVISFGRDTGSRAPAFFIFAGGLDRFRNRYVSNAEKIVDAILEGLK